MKNVKISLRMSNDELGKAFQQLPKLEQPRHTAFNDDYQLTRTGGYTKRQMQQYALKAIAADREGLIEVDIKYAY